MQFVKKEFKITKNKRKRINCTRTKLKKKNGNQFITIIQKGHLI